MRSLLTNLMNHGAYLVAGALVGVALTACPGPKQIGEESDTNINEMCMDGDMKPADDGCNTCTCLDGAWACTEKGCNNDAPPQPECEDGDEMPAPDGCNTCTCYEGMWACTQLGCVNTTTDPSETATYGETGDTFGSTTVVSVGESSGGDTEPAVCGDGALGGAEECDDGNVADGDGCSANCTLEGVGECLDKPQDQLEVMAAKIEVDTLVIDVQYGGGCETHDIGYCWDGAFAESDPVQTWLDLWHDGHGDMCDANVMEQRMLDLTELKTAWQTGYQQEHGEIIIHLEGWGEDLLYTF